VHRKLPLVGAATLASACAVAGTAGAAAHRADAVRPPATWATINICDTASHPDAVGIRGHMPGVGDAGVALRMRFRLEYRRGARWARVKGATSPWVPAGAGDQRFAEAGWTFTVSRPAPRRRDVYRGTVTFRWTGADGTVLREARRVTRDGHPGTTGADPANASAATCTVR
jgi:hypothetical protein